MGQFGQCLETRIRQLWHYNTTFGSLTFNIAAIQMNILQLIITAVLLGVWHSYVTIEYVWWPAFECVRIFVLTMCRADVLLKDVNEIRSNSRASAQTRKIIMLCNLIGAASMLIGAPIFLILLPQYNVTMYWMFIITYLILIASRIALTIPMFAALIYGTSMYRIIDGNNYERISDDRQQYATDPLLAGDDPLSQERGAYDIPEDVRIVMEEEVLLRRAIEASRRERDRSIREQQDREYQEALEQQRQLDEQARMSANPLLDDNDLQTSGMSAMSAISTMSGLNDVTSGADAELNNKNINNNSNNNVMNKNSSDNGLDELVTDGMDKFGRSMSSISSASSMSSESQHCEELTAEKEKGLEREKEEARQEIIAALPQLGEEPTKSAETVSVRVRLPSGKRCMRRFNYKNSMEDVKNWVNHELVLNSNEELINEFDLVATMPRTVYNDASKTLEDLKFWRPNSKRECHTPLLYVEENMTNNESDEEESSEQ